MSTTATPEVQAPKKPKIPATSPYIANAVICRNRDCLAVLFPKVSTEKGGEPTLQYDCENCHYSFYASLIHAQGTYKALGQDNKQLPGVMGK